MSLSCLAAIQKLENIKALQKNFEHAASRALGEKRDFEEADDLYKKLESALAEFKRNLTESLDGFEYNKEQARKFYLKEVHLEAYPDAQKWIDALRTGEIKLKDENDVQTFVDTWQEENPGLPAPSFSFDENDFSYLSALKKGQLFKTNDETSDVATDPYVPEWDNTDMILMEDWEECDYNSVDSDGKNKFDTQSYRSPLIGVAGLGLETRTLLSRREIDRALWKYSTAYGEKTEKHKQVLQKLGLNPEEFTIRLIRYEEYVRLADSQKFGKKKINTHFDGYYLPRFTTEIFGLRGEQFADDRPAAGNLSYLASNNRRALLAYRLVVAREKK